MNVSLFLKLCSRNNIVLLLVTCFLLNACKQEPQFWKLKSTEQLAGDYIANNPEQYSEFNNLIEITGLKSLLNIRGPYTIILPTNDAMFEYYKQKNVNGLSDFSEVSRAKLIRNHIICSEILTGDIGLGALRDTNAVGDFLATEFQGADIIINKYSKIIKKDIRTANGYIHVVDKVLDPITQDVYSIVLSNPSFKIFSEALNLTGIKDTLSLISFPYGKKTARTRFTLLAVPDSIFNRYGINNVDDLIIWCGTNRSDNLNYIENPFYRYMEYHCMNGCYFFSDFNTGIYSILSHDNNLSIAIEEDYKINKNSKTKNYTGFLISESNIPAKNGAIHVINDILPVANPEPAEIIFDTCDFFDLKQGDYYGKYFSKWSDGENTFANIHWVGDFMQYYYYDDAALLKNRDCLQIMGWWSISVTFPKVMKGKYEVSIFQPTWQDVTSCRVYMDGEMTNYSYVGPRTGGPGGLQKIADVDFKTTVAHTITLTNYAYGMVFWDYVKFSPVK